MPTSLPAIANLTGASVTEAGFKTELTNTLAALRERGDPLGLHGCPQNLALAFSVAGFNLTCAVKQRDGSTNADATNVIAVPFRNATAASGSFTVRAITAALSLTISSGSTLGHASGVAGPVYWYLLDNSGTVELAASAKFFGLGGLVSTTAEGGLGAADSATVMYSATARTSVPYVCVGRTVDTQTTAGTWTAVPTETHLAPFTPLAARLDGSTTSPAGLLPVCFDNDEDTGLYRPAANTVSLAAAGADALQATNPASAVNYLTVLGAAAGNEVVLGAAGADASVTLRLTAKAAGNVDILTGTGSYRQARVLNTTGAVNYVQVTGASAGNNPAVTVEGTDANPHLKLEAKGSGTLVSTSVYNKTSASAANVFIDAAGLLYRSTSSLKYKSNVKDYDKGLAELLALRPVTYKSKQKNDGKAAFAGFVAEEVHAAGLPEFVVYGDNNEPDALQYGQMIALAVKAIQELAARVAALEAAAGA